MRYEEELERGESAPEEEEKRLIIVARPGSRASSLLLFLEKRSMGMKARAMLNSPLTFTAQAFQ